MKRASNIIWGAVLIAIGVIFALNSLGITDVTVFFDGWWTLFIIIPCAAGLVTSRDKTGNIIGILIGVVLLLSCRDVIEFETVFKLIVPVIIVIIGIKLIFKGGRSKPMPMTDARKDGAPLKQCCATFSGQNADYTGEVFTGAEFNAIFGGIKCDLRNAVIENDAVINVCCVFGGVDILAPDNVNIKPSSISVFGGISVKEHKSSADNKVTLYINGTCLFGGVDIK